MGAGCEAGGAAEGLNKTLESEAVTNFVTVRAPGVNDAIKFIVQVDAPSRAPCNVC